MTGRARLTVDLEALAQNHATLTAAAAGAELAPVVKADAYGLGAGPVARRLWAEGARSFFVARVEEGEALRETLGAGRSARIYVLDGAPAGSAPRLAAARLTPVLNSTHQVAEASGFARGHGPMDVAIHIDTGMNRLGLRPEEADALAPADLAGLDVGLVMSHLACSGDPDHPLNRLQLNRFRAACGRFPGARRSLANSAGVFMGPDYRFDLVRPGIALYGGGPSERHDPRIRPVATLQSPVLQVRTVRPGESVGYGASFIAERPTRVAIIAAGYADGVLRSGAATGDAWLAGGLRRFLGRISMDLAAVDLTDAGEAAPGDLAELFGERLSVDEAAAAAGTNSYELLTRVGARVERVYPTAQGVPAQLTERLPPDATGIPPEPTML